MTNDIKNVTLSFCCNKEWKALSSVDERKRFCDSCKLHVVDFTQATAAELTEAGKTSQRLCGRFTRSQLSDAFVRYAAAAVVASALTTACNMEVAPQLNDVQTETVDPPLPADEIYFLGEVALPRDTIMAPDSLKIDDKEMI